MNNTRKFKYKLISVLLVFIFTVTLVFSVFIKNGVAVYAYITDSGNADLPTDIIDNLYYGNGKFNKGNLDALAQTVNYAGIDEMVEEVSKLSSSDPLVKAKNSTDFGDTVVNFGTFINLNNETRNLCWIPAYVSNSEAGPILTLWLAGVSGDNTYKPGSAQEVSGWSDGYSVCASTNPSSDNYSTSLIRAVINNGGTYYGDYGYNDSTTTVVYPRLKTYTTPTGDHYKFEIFTNDTTLSNSIVTPNQVCWQKNSAKCINDPLWNGASYGHRSFEWLNDKLWLPSVYEVYNSEITDDSTASYHNSNGGLWGTLENERAGYFSWTRSADYSSYQGSAFRYVFGLNYGDDCSSYYAYNEGGVRPALHLNLSEAAKNAEYIHSHTFSEEWTGDDDNHWHAATCEHTEEKGDLAAHDWGEGEVTTQPSCSSEGVRTFTCSICKRTKTAAVSMTAHSFSTDWSTNATNHWHQCGKCEAKSDDAGHNFVWITDKEATYTSTGLKHEECTVCKYKQKENTVIEKLTCTHANTTLTSAVEPTCIAGGNVEYRHCNDCGKNINSSGGVIADVNLGVDPLNHKNLTHYNPVVATCAATGNVEYWHCADCNKNVDSSGKEIADITIPKDDDAHNLVHHDAQEVTCTVNGWNAYDTCTRCTYTTYSEIKALGHNYVAAEGGVAPTCTTAGSGKLKCSRCNDEKVGETIPALGHNWATEWSKDDTNHWHTCSRCTEKGEFAAHNWNDGEITSPGVKTFTCTACSQTKTENFDPEQNEIWGLTLESWAYGDPANTPVANAKFGEITYTYSDGENGEFSAAVPTYAGEYWVKATVAEAENGTYTAAEIKANFEIAKREITVTINGGSSEQGAELEALSATVTSGSIVSGDTNVYELSTTADKDTFGSYTITGTCLNDNYNITFVDGVYIVSKRADDPHGGGSIDIPADANIEFKVTQSKTTGDYSDLDGMKVGYWAQLWYRNGDGTLGDEYTENLNCILTLKIPTEIIEAIRGGEEINRDKIAAGLSVYYATDSGLEEVKAFSIAQREDESWIVKFNYNSKFRAEVVFNAPEVEEPAGEPTKSGGIPWWVWLIVGIGGATLISVIIVAIVVIKKKNNGGNGGTSAPVYIQGGKEYDDAELKAQLAAQNKRLEDLENRDDGGFGDIYNGEV